MHGRFARVQGPPHVAPKPPSRWCSSCDACFSGKKTPFAGPGPIHGPPRTTKKDPVRCSRIFALNLKIDDARQCCCRWRRRAQHKRASLSAYLKTWKTSERHIHRKAREDGWHSSHTEGWASSDRGGICGGQWIVALSRLFKGTLKPASAGEVSELKTQQ